LVRLTDRSAEIGKKPYEADLSYTAVCTGSAKFFSDACIGKEAKGRKETYNTLASAEGAKEERLHCGKKRRRIA
jgi:hypothetical protein